VTIQIIPMFITKLKRPKVKILRGRVMTFKIGLIKKLIKPRTKPANSKNFTEPVNFTSGINLWAKYNPKIPAKIWEIKRLTIIN